MVTSVYLCDFGGGSGYSPGDYATFDCDGPGETDLVVHVASVSGNGVPCIAVNPARSPIYYGDTTMLLFQGNYAWDQPFNVQMNGDGLLCCLNSDYQPATSFNVWWPASIYYQAPEPPYHRPPGPIVGSIRNKGEIINNSNKLSVSKFRDTLKAKLMNLQNKIGIASTDRAKINDILKRLKALDESQICPACTIVVKGIEPILEVTNPPQKDFIQKIQGTDLPTMPNPVIRAQLKNFTGGEVDFHYVVQIQWVSEVDGWVTPQDLSEQYTGDTTGTNDQKIDWALNLDQFGMRGGNQITLTVTATTKVDGNVYTTNPSPQTNPFIIQGLNPSETTILAEFNNHIYADYTVDNYAAVSWNESRFNQFANSVHAAIAHPNSTVPAYPLQGSDGNDFGLMGIHLPNASWDYPCDDLIWNWVANVQQGQTFFNAQIDTAKNYQNRDYFKQRFSPTPDALKNVPTSIDISQNQVFLQAYAYYNGGTYPRYWKWVPPFMFWGHIIKQGYWIKDTESYPNVVPHVDAVWNWFTSNPKPW